MDLGLSGRTAIVTGGSRGIGRACVELLLREGAQVCAVGYDEARLAALKESTPGPLVTAAGDLRTAEGCDHAVQVCRDAFGATDILVNCAGAAGMGNVLSLETETIDSALALKFHGYLRMAQRVAPSMKDRGWGRIINVAGAAGTSPTAENLPTSLANITVHNLTRALSDALAPHGVLVNLVSPGLTLTDRAHDLMSTAAARQNRDPSELIEEAGAALPAGRVATPDEVARVVCFLASDACSYLHSSVLYMDGGARRGTP